MTFWDSSALLGLIVEEDRSQRCRALRRAHPEMAVWILTRTELTSAIRRMARERTLDTVGIETALNRLEALAARWTEIEGVDEVRERAERLLAVHALTAADALQLAAALVLAGDRPRRRVLLTADEKLAAAARAEGFSVELP